MHFLTANHCGLFLYLNDLTSDIKCGQFYSHTFHILDIHVKTFTGHTDVHHISGFPLKNLFCSDIIPLSATNLTRFTQIKIKSNHNSKYSSFLSNVKYSNKVSQFNAFNVTATSITIGWKLSYLGKDFHSNFF